jgi:hypothetical protein
MTQSWFRLVLNFRRPQVSQARASTNQDGGDDAGDISDADPNSEDFFYDAVDKFHADRDKVDLSAIVITYKFTISFFILQILLSKGVGPTQEEISSEEVINFLPCY